MEAFRLLSRSTNLNRKGAAKNRITNVIPSAGEASNPQLFGAGDSLTALSSNQQSETQSQSKKRKRQGSGQSNDISKELNSSGHAAAEHTSTSIAGASPEVKGKANHELNPEAAGSPGIQLLPEEECRRILNAHKIKITQLWTSSTASVIAEDAKADRKKRKRDSAVAQKPKVPPKHKKHKQDIIPQPLRHFNELRTRFKVSRRLAENLEEQGYSVPTEVQLGSLPLLLHDDAAVNGTTPQSGDEKHTESTSARTGVPNVDIDLLTVAPTGSGKTLAFLIPVINALLKQRATYNTFGDNEAPGPKAFVVAPTKELAGQIVNEAKKLAARTGIRVSLVRKGMAVVATSQSTEPSADQDDESEGSDDEEPEDAKIQNIVTSDVLVSTPLNLLHAVMAADKSIRSLPSVRHLVLDEADVLLDELFREQTLQIWSALTNPLLRVSLWSATMGSSIEDLAQSTIEERWHNLDKDKTANADRAPLVRLVVGLKDSAIPNIQHKLVYAATEEGKLMALRQLLRPSAPVDSDIPRIRPPFLVFVQTIPRAIALHSELLYDIPPEAGGSSRIAVLHADLSDTARETVMTRFRRGEIWVLITTDLLSRGVDFRGVNGVVNYDFPNSSAAYVHRVGRTGRAGREGGIALTLYAKEDIPFVKNVANVIAAAERQKSTGRTTEGLQQWLLDAMPKPSKRDKQRLKKRGVESRRSGNAIGKDGKPILKTKISTKSGFKRKLEHNRRGAVGGRQNRATQPGQPTNGDRGSDDDGEFSGFDD